MSKYEPPVRSLLGTPVLTRAGDWSGYAKALDGRPEELLEAVKAANVRGRGGAGFPAGMKWQFARAARGDEKFIVANGDEGDPGSYIDKVLMESSPHLLLPHIKARLYFGHAVQDRTMPQEAIENLNRALQAWAGQYESQVYEGAYHGWTVPDSPAYNHQQAERAFEKLKGLFGRALLT